MHIALAISTFNHTIHSKYILLYLRSTFRNGSNGVHNAQQSIIKWIQSECDDFGLVNGTVVWMLFEFE